MPLVLYCWSEAGEAKPKSSTVVIWSDGQTTCGHFTVFSCHSSHPKKKHLLPVALWRQQSPSQKRSFDSRPRCQRSAPALTSTCVSHVSALGCNQTPRSTRHHRPNAQSPNNIPQPQLALRPRGSIPGGAPLALLKALLETPHAIVVLPEQLGDLLFP